MTPLWTATDAARATGGAAAANWTATGVSIDTRTLKAGDLFVALRGPNHDGHQFVAAAFERGAAAAMVDRRPAGLPSGAALLHVEDTLAGLGALGGFARSRTSARVIAVTGSVGKTGTKEALRLALLAHQTLGCRGVSRADFRYDDTGAAAKSKKGKSKSAKIGKFYLLEINTQPGMTPRSLVPEIAAHAKMSFRDLVVWLVENARCDS